MNRRTFVRTAGCAAALHRRTSASLNTAQVADTDLPFPLSVMLWTVFRKQPFPERLEKIVEAGYKNVELIGEYNKWSENDFKTAIAKQKVLGIRFDVTAGLKHGVGNPADREALLADVQH